MRAFVIAVGFGFAALFLARASAGPPPPIIVHFAETHEQPVAGRSFTGISITYLSTRIRWVRCYAKIGSKGLSERQQRFFSRGIEGPAAISCSWDIPASARGRLTAHAVAFAGFAAPPQGSLIGSPNFSWRIKR